MHEGDNDDGDVNLSNTKRRYIFPLLMKEKVPFFLCVFVFLCVHPWEREDTNLKLVKALYLDGHDFVTGISNWPWFHIPEFAKTLGTRGIYQISTKSMENEDEDDSMPRRQCDRTFTHPVII